MNIRIEMNHLGRGMYPGVGAPGAHDPDGGTGDDTERPLQYVLHGIAAGLRLPAGKGCAIVFDAKSDPHGDQPPVAANTDRPKSASSINTAQSLARSGATTRSILSGLCNSADIQVCQLPVGAVST